MTRQAIENMSEKKFAKVFKQVCNRINKDPMANFVKAKGFMNFTPSFAQQVILKVIFKQKLDNSIKVAIPSEAYDENDMFYLKHNTLMTEVELYEDMTGVAYNAKDSKKQVINKINLVCGRRSGKTTLVAIIAILSAIQTNWKPFLHKTPFATILIMSHSREFSDEVLDTIKLFIKESPILSKLINHDRKQTASTLNLSIPFLDSEQNIEESHVQIKVGAASSKTTRGIAACVVICDEIAYWNLDENMKETDTKVLKAVRPALKQFGEKAMLFKLSSPGIKQGILYDEYHKFKLGKLPPSYVVFKAPTWRMNTIIPEQELIEEFYLDPEGFMVEYKADFLDSLSNFILPDFVDMAVASGVGQFPPDDDIELKYKASLDAAFKADKFTFTLVASSQNQVRQFLSKDWQGTKKNPVKAHEVANWIKNATKDYPIECISADQFAFQPLKEIFNQYDLILEEVLFSSNFKKKIYYNLKKLIHSQQVDLLDISTQTKELKELMVEQSPSGAVKIGHPRGGSDDFADSLATAVYLAVEGQGSGVFSFEDQLTPDTDYGIETDVNGVSFQAPSPEILVRSGHLSENIYDNSSEYGIDPLDGRLKRWENFVEELEREEAEGEGHDSFSIL